MSPIEIIAASAGTGKTTRLARVIEDEIASGRARPEGVVATTFTRRAAAELEERVRERLLASGRVADAERLGAARIGTVHAIAGRLVVEFALDLGLAPDLEVLDERAASTELRRALATTVRLDEQEELAALRSRMTEFDWPAAVESMIALARSNEIGAAALGMSARRSCEEMQALLGTAAAAAAPLDAALEAALDRFVHAIDARADKTKKTAEAIAQARRALATLRRGSRPCWKDWAALARLEPAARSRAHVLPVQEAAAAHDVHPALHADVLRAIELVFEISGRAVAAYEEHKRASRVIDFVDQEALALRVLEDAGVAARLREELDLFVVDEFQDTSPIQLAIFLKLAAIARKTVWVGDQKQSIYGFRGTDPALMDAAVESILSGREPEALVRSYRSRPELVRVTSLLFERAFARVGLPPSRVRLEPALVEEPGGLGPVFERWRLDGKTREGEARALAAALRDFLADPEVRVRDRDTGEPRPPGPGDVAILCRTNEGCGAVAHALATLGIDADLPRPGVLGTPEGCAVFAALKLWVDPRDTLARAEIARVAELPGDGDAWLAAVLADGTERGGPFAELSAVRRIGAAREAAPALGPVAAFDAATEAVGAIDLCLALGDLEERMANIEALRAHAVAYEAAAGASGPGGTPAGLVAYLEALAAEGRDERPARAEGGGVAVLTWHGAKGLEFPVAVLFELEGARRPRALGIHAACDRKAVSLEDPLGGRWIRYWPMPYHGSQLGTPLAKRANAHPAAAALRDAEERQALRLVYVAWTRARDRLVLAARPGALDRGALEPLCDASGRLIGEPANGRARWAGRSVAVRERSAAPQPRVARPAQPGRWLEPKGPRKHPPAYVVPSALEAAGAHAGVAETIGEGIAIAGELDWQALGDAMHAFFAADRPALARAERIEIAAGLLGRYGLLNAVAADALARAGEALSAWIDRRWPSAARRREWPVLYRLENGGTIRGVADLVVEHDGHFVVIDHKCLPPGRAARWEEIAAFAGQLQAYAAAIAAATGRTVEGTFVHLPVGGVIVHVSAKSRFEHLVVPAFAPLTS